MMLCSEPEGVMEQEAQYLAALATTATFQIDGNTLTLRDANGAMVANYTVGEAMP
jgi:heat shock protein HslJ